MHQARTQHVCLLILDKKIWGLIFWPVQYNTNNVSLRTLLVGYQMENDHFLTLAVSFQVSLGRYPFLFYSSSVPIL